MTKCIVTGAAGFIGCHLSRELKDLGVYVIGIDNLSNCDKSESLARSLSNIRYSNVDSFYYKDFGDSNEMRKIKNKEGEVETIFHVGALPRVQFSIAEPIKTHNSNINGTFHLLMSAKDIFNTNRFVFSSSSSIYGNQETLPLSEDMVPNPLSPYALHKLTGEIYCKQFFNIYGLETICLRYFNVYGPRQDPTSDYSALIPKFTKIMHDDEQPIIYGDGDQTRDMTYIEDVISANLKAASTKNKKSFGKVFNIGSGNNHSVNKVFRLIREHLGKKDIEPIHSDPVVESRHTKANIDKAWNYFGWEPKTNFKDGLVKTVNSIIGDYK